MKLKGGGIASTQDFTGHVTLDNKHSQFLKEMNNKEVKINMMRSQGTLKCRHDRNTVFAEETPRDRAVSALKDHHPPPPIHGNIMIPAYDRWKMPAKDEGILSQFESQRQYYLPVKEGSDDGNAVSMPLSRIGTARSTSSRASARESKSETKEGSGRGMARGASSQSNRKLSSLVDQPVAALRAVGQEDLIGNYRVQRANEYLGSLYPSLIANHATMQRSTLSSRQSGTERDFPSTQQAKMHLQALFDELHKTEEAIQRQELKIGFMNRPKHYEMPTVTKIMALRDKTV